MPDRMRVPEPDLLSEPVPLIEWLILMERPVSTSNPPPALFKTTGAPEGIDAAAENRTVPPLKFTDFVSPRAAVFESCNVPALIFVSPE